MQKLFFGQLILHLFLKGDNPFLQERHVLFLSISIKPDIFVSVPKIKSRFELHTFLL